MFHSDGLMLLHFGKTGPQSASISGTIDAPIEASGNSISGGMVKSGDKLKIYYNDESRHGAVGSFEISGLNTINTYSISYPLPTLIPLNLYDIRINCLNETSSILKWSINESSDYSSYIIEYSNINNGWTKINTLQCNKNPNYNEYIVTIPNFNYNTLYKLSVIKYDGTIEVIKIIKPLNCGTEQTVKIYPNPFGNSFNVETTEFIDDYELMVFDNLGNMVYNKNCHDRQETINFEYFNDGIYFIRVLFEGNILYQTMVSKINN